MFILLAFAFIAGIVTVLSPCILPVLPIVLASSVATGKKRPVGIVIGFILSFTFFTLFLTQIVKLFGIPNNSLRIISELIILIFGVSLIFDKFQNILESLFSLIASHIQINQNKEGFWGGVVIGASLGILWTPCVGPILASVIALALTNSVNLGSFFITLSYSIGTAIPMFFIILGSQKITSQVRKINGAKIQKAFGIVMIITGVALFLNFDINFQNFILTKFPSYGAGLTQIEKNQNVLNALKDLKPLTSEKNSSYEINLSSGQWFNSSPLSLKDLKGKVVLVDFWTYTCINCIRTLPYTKAWYDKYKDKGFVLVGVHTPEFEFEKDPKNVNNAIHSFGITYPVVQDNDYKIWNSFGNQYWPAEYLIDKNGQIVHTQFGEGDYDVTEKNIQDLLSQGGPQVTAPLVNANYEIDTQTPETYLGSNRSTNPSYLKLTNDWQIFPEYALSNKDSEILLNFDAKNVYLVMKPVSNKNATVDIYLDNVKQKTIKIDQDMLYTLIELQKEVRGNLKLHFNDKVEVYAFTFG